MKPEDAALFGQFSRIGLTKDGFDPSKLSEPRKRGLGRALEDAPLVAVAAVASSAQARQGWSYVTGLDNFGYNYPLRAVVAGPYLGGQGERCRESRALANHHLLDQAGLAKLPLRVNCGSHASLHQRQVYPSKRSIRDSSC